MNHNECTDYGYDPTRNGTRALAKVWECSFNKSGQASGRTRTSPYNTPSRYIELFAIAYTSENPSEDGQCEIAGDTADMHTNCGKVRAQAELVEQSNAKRKQD